MDRSMRRALIGAALAALLLAGCSGSSDDAKGDSGASASTSGAKAYVKDANEVCTSGKVALSKVTLTADVVPKPKTKAQKSASAAWAKATAVELDSIAESLGEIDPPSKDASEYTRVVKVYSDAADRVRSEGSTLLGDKNFLADDGLYDLGFTNCVASEKPTS